MADAFDDALRSGVAAAEPLPMTPVMSSHPLQEEDLEPPRSAANSSHTSPNDPAPDLSGLSLGSHASNRTHVAGSNVSGQHPNGPSTHVSSPFGSSSAAAAVEAQVAAAASSARTTPSPMSPSFTGAGSFRLAVPSLQPLPSADASSRDYTRSNVVSGGSPACTPRGRRQPFIIGVAGGTASGKTTVCDRIMHRLQDQSVVMLSQVSRYRIS